MIDFILKSLLRRLMGRYGNFMVNEVRYNIAKKIDKEYHSIIQSNIFNGVDIRDLNLSWWSSYDLGSILMGIYEREVHDLISHYHARFATFVDIGAADGYYVYCSMKKNLFSKYIAYEIVEQGRKNIDSSCRKLSNYKNLKINAGIDPVSILKLPSNSLILCDIEGYEYELFSKSVFEHLRDSLIIIEIHKKGIKDSDKKLIRIIEDSKDTHRSNIINSGSREINKFRKELGLNDNEAWLICSEGRHLLGTWLILIPESI